MSIRLLFILILLQKAINRYGSLPFLPWPSIMAHNSGELELQPRCRSTVQQPTAGKGVVRMGWAGEHRMGWWAHSLWHDLPSNPAREVLTLSSSIDTDFSRTIFPGNPQIGFSQIHTFIILFFHQFSKETKSYPQQLLPRLQKWEIFLPIRYHHMFSLSSQSLWLTERPRPRRRSTNPPALRWSS